MRVSTRWGRVVLVLALVAATAHSQAIEASVGAGRPAEGFVEPGRARAVVVHGLAGERVRIAFAPRKLFPSEGWEVSLLRDGEPTQTYVVGPKQAKSFGAIDFTQHSSVALVVRPLGDSGGMYRVCTRSHLPKGIRRPEVVETVSPSQAPATGLTLHWSVSTPLRPGLELRVQQIYHVPSYVLPQAPQPPAQLVVSAPWTDPVTHVLAVPELGQPWPKTWLHTYQPASIGNVAYETDQGWLKRIRARVRRLPAPKKIKGPMAVPVATPWADERLDAFEVVAGAHLAFDATHRAWTSLPCSSAEVVEKSVHATLTSIGDLTLMPVDLAVVEPVVLATQGVTEVSIGLDLPDDLAPGLYRLLISLGTPGDSDPCCDGSVKACRPLVVRVHGP